MGERRRQASFDRQSRRDETIRKLGSTHHLHSFQERGSQQQGCQPGKTEANRCWRSCQARRGSCCSVSSDLSFEECLTSAFGRETLIIWSLSFSVPHRITFTPFKNSEVDSVNQVANQNVLRQSEVGEAAKEGYDLAAPITFTPYKSDDHSNPVANPENLAASEIGEKMKNEGEMNLHIVCIVFIGCLFDLTQTLVLLHCRKSRNADHQHS